MTHRIIVGKTLSGKTTLAQVLAWKHHNRGESVFVMDAQGSQDWTCDRQFGRGEFQEYLYFLLDSGAHAGGAAFIDEAGLEESELRRIESNRLIIDARHRGLALYFIAHGIKQLPPIIRRNVTTLYAFQLSPDDAAEAARVWYEPGDPLLRTPRLKRFEFLKQTNFKGGQWFKLEPVPSA